MTTDRPASLPPLPCYLNGEFTTLPEAKVSVMDRGFLLGDGVYEVVPVYSGQLFRFDEHMDRLDRSLAELRIPNPMTRPQWRDVALRLVAGHAAIEGDGPQSVYLQITRGVALRDHAMLPGLTPTVFMTVTAAAPATPAQRSAGVACVTAEDFRWRKAHIKAISLLGAVMARQISVDAGAAETIMFRDGFLSEGASSNVWIVKNGAVAGTPRDNLVLEGIRYGLVETLCREAGIPFELRRIGRDEVAAADEVILSSAGKEVLPVTRLDGRPVGKGLPGPIYERLYDGYQQLKPAQPA
ncbi:MAG: D-amino acid aminotransferase [Comamonadaceae bacterium]|nr:MAG: D-amino acid aminotransferase [Comamonadaceae bacterium]